MKRQPPTRAIETCRSAKGMAGGLYASWWVRIVAIALALLMQGPAMLLQEVAWTKMLVTYTQQRGLARGVVETFDGDHPCALCVKASEIREKENRDDPAERQDGSLRFRFAWAEMICATLLILPAVPVREMVTLESAWPGNSHGRGADAPVPPPPERV